MYSVRPEDFKSDAPPERIIGIECEYSPQTNHAEKNYDTVFDMLGSTALKDVGFRRKGDFLQNGGRIYPELTYFLEFATPESLGPRDAVVSDFAGMVIVKSLVDYAEPNHKGVYRSAGTFKPSDVGRNTTTGYHENYLAPATSIAREEFRHLLPLYLATRTWAGQGALRNSGFVLSQKVWGIGEEEVISGYGPGRRTAVDTKPMITVLSEDDTVTDGWSRVEVRFADPGQSPAARLASVGGFSVLLRAAEQHEKLGNVRLDEILPRLSYADLARFFANGTSFSKLTKTIDGKALSVVDFQESLLEVCENLSTKIQLPEDEKMALKLWRKIIDRLKLVDLTRGEFAGTDKLLDNMALYSVLFNMFDQDYLHARNPEAMAVSLMWNRISPDGLAQKWWKRHDLGLIDKKEVEDRVHNPPHTRAHRRAAYMNSRDTINLYWNSRSIGDGKRISIGGPY